MNEPDIGSGEKTAEQRDIDKLLTSLDVPSQPEAKDNKQTLVPAEEQKPAEQRLPCDDRNVEEVDRMAELERPPGEQLDQEVMPAESQPDAPRKILQNETHIARATIAKMSNGFYEAQVYVRLTREPEIAETYIPAGIFASESEAFAAAEERAKRALEAHEF
jgi:hypothetical protein